MNKKVKFGLIFGVVLVGVAAGGYWLVKRAERDRAAAMAFNGLPPQRASVPPSTTRTVKTYTAKDLEEARKSGKTPADMKNSPAQSNAMNDAVQRNLRTLDEINRINQMNQRLMEQQEQMRRQNKTN